MALKHLKAANFDAAVKGPTPVLVDFYTTWCGPCRMLAPILENLSTHFAGRLDIMKVNLEEEPSLAARFQVMAVPTLMLFKGGIVIDTIVGMLPADALRDRLEASIGRSAAKAA